MTPLQVQAVQGQESHNQITHFSPDRVEIEVKIASSDITASPVIIKFVLAAYLPQDGGEKGGS